ncbi:MAG TPA: electron transport complex subunit RsxG [Woeseiaceae bacterium]
MAEPRNEQPSPWRAGLTLAVLAAVCSALVALTRYLTAPRIAANEQAALEQRLTPSLGDLLYDNDLLESQIMVQPPNELPGNRPVPVYPVRSGGRPVAAVFVVDEPGGYAGPIRLMIAIRYSGELSGVRVLAHRETPGIGDRIEPDKSDWLQQFKGVSLEAPERNKWAVKRDGGAFDQITGATITTRAVVRAVRQTLIYFEAHRDEIFAMESRPADKDQGGAE